MAGQDFATVRRRVLELHAVGEYATALEVARDAAAAFPGEAARTTYWMACLHSLLGDETRALEALEEGSRRGLWWAPEQLEADPDLESLRSDGRFRAIVDAGRLARASAAALPPRNPIVRDPASGKPRAALVVLHARGQRAEDVIEPWAAAEDALLVAPHSTQPFDPRDGCWDDAQRGEADVRRAIDTVQAGAELADLPLVVVGFSQGGGLAVFLAARRRLSGVVGCIAMAPTASWARELVGPDASSFVGLRFALLMGTLDPRLNECRQLADELSAGGAEVRLDVIGALSHDYPADFARRLSANLGWILDEPRSRA